jgi:hypothetical protein
MPRKSKKVVENDVESESDVEQSPPRKTKKSVGKKRTLPPALKEWQNKLKKYRLKHNCSYKQAMVALKGTNGKTKNAKGKGLSLEEFERKRNDIKNNFQKNFGFGNMVGNDGRYKSKEERQREKDDSDRLDEKIKKSKGKGVFLPK